MKKVLFGLLLLILVVVAVFYKQILSTIDFYQYQQENAETFTKATIKWEQIPFSSNNSSGMAADSLTFYSLQVPVPYGATKKVGKDAAMAVGYSELITINRSDVAEEFFRMYNFSEIDKKASCAFLSQTSGRGACTSNYNFYHAFLELNKTDIHLLTSIQNKELYNRLLPIRTDLLPGNTVSGFETKNIRGFLFSIDNKEFVAHVFDSEDQMYVINFSGIEEARAAFVLSNTTIIQ